MEDPKSACVNFRIPKKYKGWLEELILEEGLTSASDYFNKQIFTRRVEFILKKLINEAKRIVSSEFELSGKIWEKIDSPCDVEGIFPEKEKEFKNRWVEETKKLVISNLSLEEGIENLSNIWPQIADFTSDYGAIRKLVFIAQKSERLRDLANSEDK